MPKEVFKCEKCETEFEKKYDCIKHESECINEQDIINLNYKEALSKLKETHKLNITKSYAELRVDNCDGWISKLIQIGLQGSLPNGHEINDDDPYYTFDNEKDISSDTFYNYIESKLILPYLETFYEGELHHMYSDWGNKYIIGNLELDEICRRFYGKKIRIAVVE